MKRTKSISIPKDYPVQPLKPGQKAKDKATCGTCGLSWDDATITEYTPAPSARCPFEAFHTEPVTWANAEAGDTIGKPKAQHTGGRDPLCWLVVNPDGKLLAILDSESEAYWFTRNRGHANGAVYFKAPMDYATAPDLLEACKVLIARLEYYTRDIETCDLGVPDERALKQGYTAIVRAKPEGE